MTDYTQSVVRAKLVVPRPRRYMLHRPLLSARLLEAQHYRLTVVQAGTGYGKSTALVSAFQDAPFDVLWYSLAEADRDVWLFLLHLIHAFRVRLPQVGEQALDMLQRVEGTAPTYQAVVETLSNELVELARRDTLLVIDDYHLAAAAAEVNASVDHFLHVLPPNVHLLIATRQRPALKSLVHWRVKGDLLEITQRDLAFSAQDIEALFHTQYGLALNARQIQRLATETEGWVIALHMIWQGLQSGVAGSLDQILEELPRSLEDLFAYLAQEVLARRPPHIQDFLLHTSLLRQLEPAACDALLGWDGSQALLSELDEQEFFVVRQGDAYRYHHLFHDFLRQRAAAQVERTRALHRRAAGFYQRQGNVEEAVYHLLAAAEHAAAAELMVQAGESMVRGGRLDTMNEWVISLPPNVLQRFPALMYHMGELCRFASRFDEALGWYEQAKEHCLAQHDVAGASRALRGQAGVYLDTVRPIKAESLLQEALRLVDGQPDREERARLLDLLAENMTNRGRSEEAEALHRQARALREVGPGLADLDVRVLLRTGRLDEARVMLEERAAADRCRPPSFREPRAHRETLLVLSLICAFQGCPDEAFRCAWEGIQLGRTLGSPFVEAVGLMRLGHAWQISNHPHAFSQALACYQQAIEIGERLAVPRTKVEALWGLCRLYGLGGDLLAAERYALEGRQVGLGAGDEWIAALIDLALGASYVMAGQASQAQHWLDEAATVMHNCGDPFGQSVAHLWQCLLYQRAKSAALPATLADLFESIRTHGYYFLLDRLTFFGPPDPAVLAPLLLAAPLLTPPVPGSSELLAHIGLPAGLDFYPGYTLRVHALGRFEVYRGQQLVDESDWRREKARQLFQLLLVNRQRWMERDEITACLWPETDNPQALDRHFKVTLNALQSALEPQRPPRVPALFVQRQGSAYRLNPHAPLWLDAAAFEHLLDQAGELQDEAVVLELYRQALVLYEGDFLSTCVYEDWCWDERERLRRRYLAAAVKTAALLLACGAQDADEAIHVCRQALAVDRCWEDAYQALMQACLQKRDYVQALRVYKRCVTCLKEELDVAPLPETTALYQQARKMLD